MTFKEYLAMLPGDGGSRRDLIKDVLGDDAFPDVKRWTELKNYLEESGAPSGALRMAKDLWDKYLHQLSR